MEAENADVISKLPSLLSIAKKGRNQSNTKHIMTVAIFIYEKILCPLIEKAASIGLNYVSVPMRLSSFGATNFAYGFKENNNLGFGKDWNNIKSAFSSLTGYEMNIYHVRDLTETLRDLILAKDDGEIKVELIFPGSDKQRMLKISGW